jgi:hypothetical protein
MISQTTSIPAPVGGVNARDSFAAMAPTDAIIMDNYFPTPSYVTLRNGMQTWASGLPGAVNTVMAYNGVSTRKLFGASVTSIYDTTAGGAVGAAVVTGIGTDKLQHAMFDSGAGNNVLIWANGSVTPQYFDGAAWANSTISSAGLTPANLITVTVHQNRCWFIEKNTMNVYYTGVGAFQGAAIKLPLAAYFKMGGSLINMASWSIQNVSGINDYAAFITSEGEVAVYQGYDPSQIATWSLVGIFRIGRPIGIRCYARLASDIVVITADGLTSLNDAILTDRTDQSKELTYKILNAINNDVQLYNSQYGWQVIDYPLGNKLIINVPEVAATTSHQWVQNQVSKAWCRFTAWNANCWELQQDALYFGGNTKVYLADVNNTDDGVAITTDCKPAFSYFGAEGKMKQFVMCRPIFQANAPIQPTITLNVDFQDVPPSRTNFINVTGALWNVSPWNTTPWGGTTLMVKNWIGLAGLGYVASGRLGTQTTGVSYSWFSTDYMFKVGGPI